MNNKSRYVIVLSGLKKKNFKNLKEITLIAIKEFLKHQCIDEEIIKEYIKKMGEIKYSKTKNRSFTTKLTFAQRYAEFYYMDIVKDKIIQNAVSLKVSQKKINYLSPDCYRPMDKLYEDLNNLINKPIIKTKALRIKSHMALDNFNINREFIIPINFTFSELHKCMQIVFNWLDYHIHDFVIFTQNKYNKELSFNNERYHKKGFKPIIRLVDSDEAFFYYDPEKDLKMELELGKKLSDYIDIENVNLPYDFLIYTYDYGDNWKHYLIIEEIIYDYKNNYPLCLSGINDATPEDVGGEGGFEEFVEITNNKNHEEYESLINWAKSNGYKKFNIDDINNELKRKFI